MRMPEWGSHLALEALPACIGAPPGGQCGAATKTLRSRQTLAGTWSVAKPASRRFFALEDPADINADETLGIDKIWTVTHHSAGIDAGVHEHAGVVAAVPEAAAGI